MATRSCRPLWYLDLGHNPVTHDLLSLDLETSRTQYLFSVNSQATTRRSSHTDGQATRTVGPLLFGNTTTKTFMARVRVPLVFPSQKKENGFNIKYFNCEVSAVKIKFDATNQR